MKTHFRFTFLVLLLVLAGLWAVPVSAQGQPPTDNEVNAVAKQLYCPVCENTPLDVCPTQACAQWRDLIRLMLSQGKSEEEIKQYFVDNYGARVLNEPPRDGLELARVHRPAGGDPRGSRVPRPRVAGDEKACCGRAGRRSAH